MYFSNGANVEVGVFFIEKRSPYLARRAGHTNFFSMFPQYKNLNLPEIDREILAFWTERRIFEHSVEDRAGRPDFVFYEGPPSANGQPGIHHVMARAIKDAFCRFRTMQGFRVQRKAGWDTHGLPIELAVEKELGITKEDIGKKISVEEYNLRCRETVMRFKDRWDDITRKMGYWVDLENPYVTFENDYIESVWHLLKRLYDKEFLYKGYSIQPYSPAAGTGLSTHELNMPGCYREVKDTTVVAMFKIQYGDDAAFLFDNEQEDVRILAWTTTPWTLPSNTALTVGPKIVYAKINTFNPYTGASVSVVLAKDLVAKWFKPEGETAEMAFEPGQKILPYRLVAEYLGSALAGIGYEQLLPFGNPIEPLDGATGAFRVITGDFVTTEDGTGVVHTAPSFGADDRRAAKNNGIGTLTLVDRQGKFVDTVGEFSGRYVKDYRSEGEHFKDVDVDIAVKLKQEGKAFNVQKYAHNYPHCWRTDKPVLYYPLDSWFVAASRARERMSELNKTIQWKPESTGTGRFGTWLDNLQDWNLSRSRYWGIPLPIWRSEDASEEKCIGSVAELAAEINKANQALGLQQSIPDDLHRPFVDEIVLVSATGQEMRRELDLIDVWFDSGAMPYAQHHLLPNDASELKGVWPADFIAEGVDQTRGWFYTLHAISVMCFDQVAFKAVVSNGLVLDAEGNKMSKRLGNAVDPFYCLDRYGADATRWYMLTNANPWDNLRFSWKKPDREKGEDFPEQSPGIEEVQRSFFGKIFNTYNFFALYANVDGFVLDEQNLAVAYRTELDRWILSKLHSLVAEVTRFYENYEPTKAGRAIEDFVDGHLSNWYVRLSRRRFWKGQLTDDKKAAFETLHECLMVTAQLMAPIAPFFADWLYKNLSDGAREKALAGNTPLVPESIHLTLLRQPDTALIDPELEQRMDYAQRISSLVLSLRKREKIRVRQPLQRILLPILDDAFEAQVDAVKNLVLAEVNVKEIEYVKDTSGLVTKKIKPNFVTLGKRLGSLMKPFQAAMAAFGQAEIAQLERERGFVFEHDGQRVETTLEDFVITSEGLSGWLVANDEHLSIALDATLTPDLEAEGLARELVSAIQDLRKSQGYEISDRIGLAVAVPPESRAREAFTQFKTYICEETLADSLSIEDLRADVPVKDAPLHIGWLRELGQDVALMDGLAVRLAVVKTGS